MSDPTILRAFRRKLKEAIEAREALKHITSLGYPHGGLGSDDVWVSGGGTSELEYELSGMSGADENLTGVVRIVVTRSSAKYESVSDEAWAHLSEVAAAIKADRTLGGMVDNLRIVRITDEEAVPETSKRQIGITAVVQADAYSPGL